MREWLVELRWFTRLCVHAHLRVVAPDRVSAKIQAQLAVPYHLHEQIIFDVLSEIKPVEVLQ